MNGWRRRQIAQDQTKGVIGSNLVVAVRDDDEDREISNPSTEEAQQLDRDAIGPVGVFGDDDRRSWSRGEGSQRLPEEPLTGVAVEGVLIGQETKRGGEVAHGAERTRRRERVARGPQHRRSRGAAGELLDQRGFANPGLAANEYHPPVPRGGLA
jgi:hypothetical protein